MRLLYIFFTLFVLVCEAQLVSMQPQQYPVHLIPAMAGSSGYSRFLFGVSSGIASSQYNGNNILFSYDQRVKPIRSGIGFYISSHNNKWNPIGEIYKDSISLSHLPEKFSLEEKNTNIGIVVSPKFNFTSFGKIIYTLSPAIYFERGYIRINSIDQLQQALYQKYSSSGQSEASSTYNKFIRQMPEIQSNCFGLSFLFNASGWYVSAGIAAKQLIVREKGIFAQVESRSESFLSKEYSLEQVNTLILPSAAAGVSFPSTSGATTFVTFSGNITGSFLTNHFDSGDSSEFRSYLESMNRSSVYHGNIAVLFRHHILLAGLSSVYFHEHLNTGFSIGTQLKKIRMLACINPFRSNMSGVVELTVQVKM